MASGSVGGGLRHFGRLFSQGTGAGLAEGQLLERGVTRRDEVALSAVVERHGPMVMGVCRHLLQDPNDADDAFQATFLVLARRAESLRGHDQLGSWLYGVALRVAKRARGDSARRRSRLSPIEGEGPPGADLDRAESEARQAELRVALHDEIARLPESYRAAVVLCYLEGKSHEEAALGLGWPIGTVKGRLSRARDLLRDRLTRRGLTASSAAIAAAMASTSEASVPASLVASTTSAAIGLTARSLVPKAGAALASTQALTLMEGALAAMYLTKIKLAATAVVAVGVAATSGLIAYGQIAPGAPASSGAQPKPAASSPAPKDSPASETQPAALGDVASSKVAIAKRGLEEAKVRSAGGLMPANSVNVWARRLIDAQLEADLPPAEKVDAIKQFLAFQTKALELAKSQVREGRATSVDVTEVEYTIAEAQDWLAKEKAKNSVDRMSMMPDGMNVGAGRGTPGMVGRGMGGMMGGMGGGGFGGAEPARRSLKSAKPHPSDEARNEAISQKFEEVIPMNFPMETALEDVIKYVKKSLKDQAGADVPFYVDPVGLDEAGKNLTSPVSIDLDGLPLRTTFRLLLNQLQLHYEIADGLVLITNGPEPAAAPPDFGAGMGPGASGGGGFR